MNLLSLYSGIGGDSLAAHWAGIGHVAFCEPDPFCQSILSRHWPGVPIYDYDHQITADSLRNRGIPAGGIDLILGTPPCQPFSVAGTRAGTSDDRHRWPEMARVVSEVRPAFVVVENTFGFVNLALELVSTDLEGIGYEVWPVVVPACAANAPHQRERLFAVAYTPESGRRRRRAVRDGEAHAEPTSSRSTMAHDGGSEQRREPLGLQGRTISAEPPDTSRPTVADDDGSGRGERRGAESVRAQHSALECGGGDTVDNPRGASEAVGRSAGRSERGDDAARSPESRLVRSLHVVSERLDGYLWPAPLGAPQFDWEQPRVTTRRDLRRKRLKALGNAVAPLQIYPLLALIHEAWRIEQEVAS